MSELPDRHAGIYLHIPFCERKCLYCDFYSVPFDDKAYARYINALFTEISIASQSNYGEFSYDTIFLGGGTPSLMSAGIIAGVLENLSDKFNIENKTEITMECNPSSLSDEKIEGYSRCGINRISLGIQSFDYRQLQNLGRLHTSDEAIGKFSDLREAGFKNISVDLIYGLPEQTLSEWRADLEKAMALKPEHISAYNLIIESGTEFDRLFQMGTLDLPDDETQGEMYDFLNQILCENGYGRYEISNFAKPGFECRHNIKYWTGMPYLGMGPSAVSFDGQKRRKNFADLEAYIISAESGNDTPSETEIIDRETGIREAIMSGLRIARGVSLENLKDRFDYDLMQEKRRAIDALLAEKMIDLENGFIRLTEKALFISDSVMVKLI